MYRIWVWQSTILKDLDDSQDPKHTLFCCENAFVAIFALFSDNKCVLFLCLGRGGGDLRKRHDVTLFLLVFVIYSLSTDYFRSLVRKHL